MTTMSIDLKETLKTRRPYVSGVVADNIDATKVGQRLLECIVDGPVIQSV